jgi:uncharacterized protein YuzE
VSAASFETSEYLGEAMATVHFGPYEFDRVVYDSEGDVLYLSRNEAPAAADTIATPEGHAVRLDEIGEVIGITIVNAKWLVERDGKISLTVPSLIETNATFEGVAITADDGDQLFSTHVQWNAS